MAALPANATMPMRVERGVSLTNALAAAWAAASRVGAGLYLLQAGFLSWLLPVTGALAVAIPVSVLTSRVSLGRRLRDAGLFVIPEESTPPTELAEVAAALSRSIAPPR